MKWRLMNDGSYTPVKQRRTCWTRDRGSVDTLPIANAYRDGLIAATELGNRPDLGAYPKAYRLTPDEAKQFAHGIKREREAKQSKPGKSRDKSRRAIKQSGGYVTSGWQAKVGGTIRLSKAMLNAETEARRRDG